ncbi:molecular chaperone DnaJ [Microbacterium mangrovi]|uniref:Molecular chaperone DnaJ n=1 Tax=Microbacterium mangrovi TaxID=1348253 RepID=A0A0B2A2J3_9MICO|nr:DUF1992 domain-containing protein [Microbacterium mangrovi]KHK95802.1 molecular chaperone DnaJ [Microbacterium mangrovi]
MPDHTTDEPHDPREAAAEYRLEQLRRERPDLYGEPGTTNTGRTYAGSSELERAAFVETAIQQAIRRGEFDNLPGAGKPLPGLGDRHDPDWWIRRKIQTEKLTGLGPPALMLRVEDRELDDRLDALHRESDVREAVEDFNRRVVEARRQLLGGPPVVTPTRDAAHEVAAWRERRDTRARAAAQAAPTEPPPRRRRGLFRRASGTD